MKRKTFFPIVIAAAFGCPSLRAEPLRLTCNAVGIPAEYHAVDYVTVDDAQKSVSVDAQISLPNGLRVDSREVYTDGALGNPYVKINVTNNGMASDAARATLENTLHNNSSQMLRQSVYITSDTINFEGENENAEKSGSIDRSTGEMAIGKDTFTCTKTASKF